MKPQRFQDGDRTLWLRSCRQTFLEGDLADLARLSDLEPFQALQKLCMLRNGRLLSFAELARDAGIAPATARRYPEYLRISYQVFLLRPFARSLTSSVVKSPKLYWIDAGLLRQGTRQWGDTTGEMFETLVVSEIHKWVSTMQRDVDLSFYRTRSGLEVDLLLQTAHGVLGIEIRNRDQPDRSDLRGLRAVAESLPAEWRGGLLVCRAGPLRLLDEGTSIWSVPAHRLF